MINITYSKAEPSDAQLVADLRIQFALELSGDQPAEKIAALREQMTDYFSKATADNSCISIMAKVEDELVGIGTVHIRELPGNFKNPSGKWGYIMNMYTLPKYRRNGICRSILSRLEEEGQKLGVTAFELHATSEGEAVYVQEGFARHNEPTLRKHFK